MTTEVCRRCGRTAPRALGVHLCEEDKGQRPLRGIGFHCGPCVEEVMAERRGEDLHLLRIAPIALTNAAGRSCLFHFQYSTTGPEPILSAFELENGEKCGYVFATVHRSEETHTELLDRLLDKIREKIARIDLRDDPRLTLGFCMARSDLNGRLECDPETRGPRVYVDGRELDWETFGQLLLSHEGFPFRLAFHDSTEEPEA